MKPTDEFHLAVAKIAHWTARRDAAVVAMRAEGRTLAQIAEATGLSRPGVLKLLRRMGQG